MARTKALQNVGITYDGDNLQPHPTRRLNATVELSVDDLRQQHHGQGPGAPSFSAVEPDARRLPAAGRSYAVRHAEDARALWGRPVPV